jgi:hypothetical protein
MEYINFTYLQKLLIIKIKCIQIMDNDTMDIKFLFFSNLQSINCEKYDLLNMAINLQIILFKIF